MKKLSGSTDKLSALRRYLGMNVICACFGVVAYTPDLVRMLRIFHSK